MRAVVRPFVALAGILLVGTVGSRLVAGLASVLVMFTVAVLGPLLVVTVRTVRADHRLNSDLGRRWRTVSAARNARALGVDRDRGAA